MARKKSSLERREVIITAADRLFNHYGFEKTTMEDISRESGIPRATIYLEFSKGKEDVLMASIERYLNQLLSEMRELARQSRSGRLETLKNVILYYILRTHTCSSKNENDTTNIDRYTKRARLEMTAFFQARHEFFVELLRHAALGGEIPEDCDLLRMADLLTQGMTAYLPPFGNRYSRDEVEKNASALFSLLLSGLAKNGRALIAQ